MSNRRKVSIKYTSREFDTIKKDLIDYIKRYYPNSYRDFNEASFGALLIDTVAYVGDILSFYIDYQANESFLESALEYENVIRLGEQLGHKFKGAPSSTGIATIYISVPASATGAGPDQRYIPMLRRGSTFAASTGTSFILEQNVHFSDESNEIRVGEVDDDTGNPTNYVIRAYGRVSSGQFGSEFFNIGDYKKFNKITLDQNDISEILSITDSEGNEYYEVDYMSQNVVYKGVINRAVDTSNQYYSSTVGEILKPVIVPRRFITKRDQRRTHITFGASSDNEIEKDYIVDPQTTILDIHGRNYISDKFFDPSKLIESDKFGVAPSNTTLEIKYRYNTIDSVNIRVGELTVASNPILDFKDLNLDSLLINNVVSSIQVDNDEPILGDITLPTSQELKMIIGGAHSNQSRAVTQRDYESYIYQMPPRFGAVKRVRVCRDNDSLRRNLNIYVISENSENKLENSNISLKKNIKTWLQSGKMINDTVDIMDARVINLSIKFSAVGTNEYSKYDIYETAKAELIEMASRVPDIGEPFFITEAYKVLRRVPGILDVTDVIVQQLTGENYSNLSYNISAATSQDGRFIKMPKNVIYEIKFPESDISGVIL